MGLRVRFSRARSSSGSHRDVEIDLKLLQFLVDKAEGRGNDRIRDLDSFQGEDAELEFVQGARGGVFEGLDLEEEDRGGGVDAVCEGEDDVVVTEGAAVEVEEGEDRCCGGHALDEVALVVCFLAGFEEGAGAEDWAVEENVDGVVETAVMVSMEDGGNVREAYFRVMIWLGGQYGGRSVAESLK